MKFILISPKNRTIYNFRGDLVREIQSKGYEVVVTGPDREGLEKIEDLGVRFEEIPLEKTGMNIFSDIKYMLKLRKLFKEEKPDVTLGYTIKPVIYGSIAAKLAGVKNINSMITGVGYVFTAETFKAKAIRFIVSILYRISFACSDTVIFQNPDDRKEFLDRGLLKKEKTGLVNGSGVNMERYKATDFPEELTFFMLSRVLHSKGIREYLEAAKIVKEKHPETKFMLLGAVENMQDSMSEEDLKPYIDERIIEHFGETDDVRDYYGDSTVFVLPSYREGTPRTVLEAMAMGRPIITTDAPGCRETVIDGKNGFLVPVGDVEALSEKMIWFINNTDKIEKMGSESKAYCKKKFDVDKVNKSMLEHMKI